MKHYSTLSPQKNWRSSYAVFAHACVAIMHIYTIYRVAHRNYY